MTGCVIGVCYLSQVDWKPSLRTVFLNLMSFTGPCANTHVYAHTLSARIIVDAIQSSWPTCHAEHPPLTPVSAKEQSCSGRTC